MMILDICTLLLSIPGHGMDIAKALIGCTPDRPIITLAHNPISVYNITAHVGVRPIDLILSGMSIGWKKGFYSISN